VICAVQYKEIGSILPLSACRLELSKESAYVRPREIKMANGFEDIQKISKTQLETAAVTSQSFVKGLQAIAAETTDYSKKSLENGSAFLEKLLGVKSLEAAIQLQSEFAKTSYADFVAEATKLGELYSNLAKEVFKPLETAIAQVQASKAQ
jgi:phasin family protein